jgi:hypothetical protein
MISVRAERTCGAMIPLSDVLSDREFFRTGHFVIPRRKSGCSRAGGCLARIDSNNRVSELNRQQFATCKARRVGEYTSRTLPIREAYGLLHSFTASHFLHPAPTSGLICRLEEAVFRIERHRSVGQSRLDDIVIGDENLAPIVCCHMGFRLIAGPERHPF